jgi:hydrogenase expression/formation protein HypE
VWYIGWFLHPVRGEKLPLQLGKLPISIMRKYVLGFVGVESAKVVVKPGPGLDFAVIKLPRGYLIASSDPVTGVSNKIGWYAVHLSANDVATSGARPLFLQCVLLLPHNANVSLLKEVVLQIHSAAMSLRISVTGGHTELTPGLSRPIVITTCFGLTDRFVTSAGVRKGDLILMSKTAAIEGTSILAERFNYKLHHLGRKLLIRASKMYEKISVVEEATSAFKTGLIHGMHDPTEGGIIGGVYEMAVASNLGFTLNKDSIRVCDETERICTALKVDPLRLISSGALLMAVDPKDADAVMNTLKAKGIDVHIIGKFTTRGKQIIKSGGPAEIVKGEVMDELWRL